MQPGMLSPANPELGTGRCAKSPRLLCCCLGEAPAAGASQRLAVYLSHLSRGGCWGEGSYRPARLPADTASAQGSAALTQKNSLAAVILVFVFFFFFFLGG